VSAKRSRVCWKVCASTSACHARSGNGGSSSFWRCLSGLRMQQNLSADSGCLLLAYITILRIVFVGPFPCENSTFSPNAFQLAPSHHQISGVNPATISTRQPR
jgi:hypothetical protein